jgi:predicted amidophosphoribosyltransferase
MQTPSNQPGNEAARIVREKQTVTQMVDIFCRAHHDTTDPLCPECQQLLDYAICRLDRCPFGERKPTCAKCPIHCYKPALRDRIRVVMKYAGPRMMWRHPASALGHLLDKIRNAPPTR